MLRFDADLTLAPAGEHRWTVEISPAWDIGDNPSGGYVQAMTLAALGRQLPHPDPLTATSHFLRPVASGAPAEIVVESVRHGSTVSTGVASLLQDGKERVRTLATFTDLDAQHGRSLLRAYPPEWPGPDDCLARDPDTPAPFRFIEQFDIRLEPGLARTSETEIGGWIRFRDGRDPDLLSMPLFADGFPPTVMSLGELGWVPTIELTIHFRAKPEPGWLQALFVTEVIRDGLFEEDGTIWDASGRVVAQSRQLAKILSG
jgi:acyl-CoA thioesterase